jgi:hypothetical protein
MVIPLVMTVIPKWFPARGEAVAALFLTLFTPHRLQRSRVRASIPMFCVSPTATRLKPLRLPPRGALRAFAPPALLPLRRTIASGWMRAGMCLIISFTVLWQPSPRGSMSTRSDIPCILRIPSSQNVKCAGASARCDVFMHWCIHVFMFSCIHVFMYSCIHVFMYSCSHVFLYSCTLVFM